jgi:predicted DNA-binding protein with PD1-like motif
MKYTSGKTGRVFVARIEHGEDLLKSLEDLAKKEKIKSGIVFLIGALHNGSLVCGPVKAVMPPLPFWQNFPGPAEIAGIGTIFEEGKSPKIHLHSAVGRGRRALVGCIRKNNKVFLIVEAVIIEIKGIKAARELDRQAGLALLRIK